MASDDREKSAALISVVFAVLALLFAQNTKAGSGKSVGEIRPVGPPHTLAGRGLGSAQVGLFRGAMYAAQTIPDRGKL